MFTLLEQICCNSTSQALYSFPYLSQQASRRGCSLWKRGGWGTCDMGRQGLGVGGKAQDSSLQVGGPCRITFLSPLEWKGLAAVSASCLRECILTRRFVKLASSPATPHPLIQALSRKPPELPNTVMPLYRPPKRNASRNSSRISRQHVTPN